MKWRNILVACILAWSMVVSAEANSVANFHAVTQVGVQTGYYVGEAQACGLRPRAWVMAALKWAYSGADHIARNFWGSADGNISKTGQQQLEIVSKNISNAYLMGLKATPDECVSFMSADVLDVIDKNIGWVKN